MNSQPGAARPGPAPAAQLAVPDQRPARSGYPFLELLRLHLHLNSLVTGFAPIGRKTIKRATPLKVDAGDVANACQPSPTAPCRVSCRRARISGPRSQTFLVERSLKGITMEQLAAAQERAWHRQGDGGQGPRVTYIRSTFVPETGQCRACSSDEASR